MPKLSQADIKAKADEWARVNEKITKAEAAKTDELQPHVEKFNRNTDEVRNRHDKKINSLRAQADEIQSEVVDWLASQGKVISLESEKAIAANELRIGNRIIDPQKFLEKAKEKGAAAWDCVTVAIAKAEKLLGKTTIDEISTKDSKLVASLKLK